MQRLWADARHEALVVVKHGLLAERQFSDWAMGYSGLSRFVAERIAPLFDEANPADQRRAAEWLVDFMHRFVQN